MPDRSKSPYPSVTALEESPHSMPDLPLGLSLAWTRHGLDTVVLSAPRVVPTPCRLLAR